MLPHRPPGLPGRPRRLGARCRRCQRCDGISAGRKPAAIPEARRLLWLGEQITTIDLQFTAAIARKATARDLALRNWPEVPAEIAFDLQHHVPDWCGTNSERDIDDRAIFREGPRPPRHVADPYQLQVFVDRADKRTRAYKDARRALALAKGYEDARAAVIASSGYGVACNEIDELARRIERIAELIHKNPHRSMAGLVIKAKALLATTRTDASDLYAGYRAKHLHAETLARGIVGLAC